MSDKDNRNPKPFVTPIHSAAVRNPEIRNPEIRNPEIDELYQRLEPALRRAKPGPEAVAAAMQSAQRLAAQVDAEHAAEDVSDQIVSDELVPCTLCGYSNRLGTKFCGMCGVPASSEGQQEDASAERRPTAFPQAAVPSGPPVPQTHHYHHHYHHHYFPGGQEPSHLRASAEPAREERLRPSAALRGEMSRAEAAVRRVSQEWMIACNTKHLDDLLELYVADPLVLRSNYPAIRGAAAVREFLFGALDAGLGEVELEPLRVDLAGDMAYEAGRFKALIPSSTGKRREERGKYLWVCARQANGEWKLAVDCWSSDLTFGTLEADAPSSAALKTPPPRKNS